MELIKLQILSYIHGIGRLTFHCTKNGEPNYILLINNEEDIMWFSRYFNMRGIINEKIIQI